MSDGVAFGHGLGERLAVESVPRVVGKQVRAQILVVEQRTRVERCHSDGAVRLHVVPSLCDARVVEPVLVERLVAVRDARVRVVGHGEGLQAGALVGGLRACGGVVCARLPRHAVRCVFHQVVEVVWLRLRHARHRLGGGDGLGRAFAVGHVGGHEHRPVCGLDLVGDGESRLREALREAAVTVVFRKEAYGCVGIERNQKAAVVFALDKPRESLGVVAALLARARRAILAALSGVDGALIRCVVRIGGKGDRGHSKGDARRENRSEHRARYLCEVREAHIVRNLSFQVNVLCVGYQHASGRMRDGERRLGVHDHGLGRHAAGPKDGHLALVDIDGVAEVGL